MRQDVSVAVVGGGIAGLAAAYALEKQGVDYELLEAGRRLGGVIRTESAGGFLLEGGPDAMLAQKPEAIALCRELGLGERLVPTNPVQKAVYVLRGGKLYPLPEGMVLAVPTRLVPLALSGLFSWPAKVRMALDLVIPRRTEDADESIGAFLRRRFGQEAVDRLGEPLLAGIHAGDPERLSIRANFRRFADLEAKHGSLIRGLWDAPKPPAGAAASAFYSLRGGLGELVEALTKRLPARALRLESAATRILRAADCFTVETRGGKSVKARALILAVPAHRAAPLLGPLHEPAGALLKRIAFVSTATVFLGFRREDVAHPLDGYGLVVPRAEGLRVSAASFFSTKFPGRAPEGHVLLRAFLGGARELNVLDHDDAALVHVVREELGGVLGFRGEPVLTRVFRWPLGTPQMEVGHLERVAELEQHLAELPGLYLTGGGLRGTGLPDCVADGTHAAQAALARVKD